MKDKLINGLKNPGYALHILRRRYTNISWTKKIFAYKADLRSDSENGEYSASVSRALKYQKYFDNFKRNFAYREVLEHVSERGGAKYLEVLQSRNANFIYDIDNTIFNIDDVGNPIKYQYPGIKQPLSPTTLRYTKVASDLSGLFPKDLEEIAEIGCGYGGQTLVNDKLLGYRHATLFDLALVNELIRRYLNSMILEGSFKVTTINEVLPNKYDLVISNYAFSELPAVLQRAYIKKVLAGSKRGYLTMNSGIGGDRDHGKLSINELRDVLPPFEVFEENPLASPYNYLIVWGHNKEFSGNSFRAKEV
jgi:hypothetical protein